MNLKDNFNLNNAKLLHEGITNESYLIDGKYVFRNKNQEIDPFNKPENEFYLIQKLAKECFVETVLDYDISTGKKLSVFIPDTYRLSSHPSDQELSMIKSVIDSLHSSKEKCINDFDPFSRIALYKQNVISEIDKDFEEKVINEAKHLYQKYSLVLSHNDLVKGNILLTANKAYLLDFEYCGNNIALFDIASFLSENDLDDNSKERFLNLFKDINKKDVQLMIIFENILWYYWAKYMFNITNKPIFLAIANSKLNSINNI